MHRSVLGFGLVFAVYYGLMLNSADSLAADPRDKFEARIFRTSDGGELPYRLLSPKEVAERNKYPLVLFFHGAGERGTDNKKQLVHGMAEFASDKVMAEHPCFVVAPQCPDKEQWVDTPWSADSHTLPEKPTTALARSLALVDQLVQALPVDQDRIYVTGLSMGGFGVWDALCRRPNFFAGAVPVCGGADAAQAKKIAHVPVWAFHGELDTAVKTKRSRDMIAALKAAGGNPKYTEYNGVAHDSWTATYKDPELYKWLFAQRKTNSK